VTVPFVIVMSFTTIATNDPIRISREDIPLRPWRQRGGGSGVAGADGAGVGLAVAADGGNEVGPEDVSGGGEERVLGAEAGEVGEEITWAVGGGEGSGSGGVGGEEVVLGAVAGVESGDPISWISGSGRTAKLSDCSEIGEAVGVGLGGGGDRAEGGVRRRGRTLQSSSTPTPLRSSTSQRLLAAFLVRFAGGGEGVSGDFGGDWRGLGRRWHWRRGLGPGRWRSRKDWRVRGAGGYCSTDGLTASTRATAAAASWG
jgi:hypothetical protein